MSKYTSLKSFKLPSSKLSFEVGKDGVKAILRSKCLRFSGHNYLIIGDVMSSITTDHNIEDCEEVLVVKTKDLTYKKGCLLEALHSGEVDLIGHQANCQGVMGSGIAKQIKEQFPLVYKADVDLNISKESKLGGISHWWRVYNLYGQFDFNKKGEPLLQRTDYCALSSALNVMAEELNCKLGDWFNIGSKAKVGFPQLGCGLGGGEWDIVSELIYNAFLMDKKGFEVYIYVK